MLGSPVVSLLLGLPGAVLGKTLATGWKDLECTARGIELSVSLGVLGTQGPPSQPCLYVAVTSLN